MKQHFLLALATLLLSPLAAWADEFCYAISPKGVMQEVDKPDGSSSCLKLRESIDLADPSKMQLEGNLRKESMPSSLGRIELFWPRAVEKILGKTPVQSMAQGARAASRALKSGGFPIGLRSLDIDWEVVFFDRNIPAAQLPGQLVNNCHPGWMIPLAKLYFAADRIARGCGDAVTKSKKVTDTLLTRVVLHEIGHAIEYRLLDPQLYREPMISEGFAEWFESYSSKYSSSIPSDMVRKEQIKLAKQSLKRYPSAWRFQGTAEDYARASLFFHAVVDRYGVKGLARVYARMNLEKIRFLHAVKKEFHWSDKKFSKELERVLNSS